MLRSQPPHHDSWLHLLSAQSLWSSLGVWRMTDLGAVPVRAWAPGRNKRGGGRGWPHRGPPQMRSCNLLDTVRNFVYTSAGPRADAESSTHGAPPDASPHVHGLSTLW